MTPKKIEEDDYEEDYEEEEEEEEEEYDEPKPKNVNAKPKTDDYDDYEEEEEEEEDYSDDGKAKKNAKKTSAPKPPVERKPSHTSTKSSSSHHSTHSHHSEHSHHSIHSHHKDSNSSAHSHHSKHSKHSSASHHSKHSSSSHHSHSKSKKDNKFEESSLPPDQNTNYEQEGSVRNIDMVPEVNEDMEHTKVPCKICKRPVELRCLPYHEFLCQKHQPPGAPGYVDPAVAAQKRQHRRK